MEDIDIVAKKIAQSGRKRPFMPVANFAQQSLGNLISKRLLWQTMLDPMVFSKVSLLGVVALWVDCMFFPEDWRSLADLCYVALFEDFSL